MRFEFATATRIAFGCGAADTLGIEAAKLCKAALVVGGNNRSRRQPLMQNLQAAGVIAIDFPVTREPEVADVEAGVAAAQEANCQAVIAVGGGSAIDAGKAIAAMLANPGELLDYLEVIGRGKALPNR